MWRSACTGPSRCLRIETMTPTPNGQNGRGQGGRFTPGNGGGPGNPFARQCAALRSAFMGAIKPEDMQAIVQALVTRARDGDLAAIKLVCTYALGTPNTAPAADTSTADTCRAEGDALKQVRILELDRGMFG